MRTTIKTNTKDVVINSITNMDMITLTLVDNGQTNTVALTHDQVGALIFGLEMANEANQVRALHA
jgi:hypothetical protein